MASNLNVTSSDLVTMSKTFNTLGTNCADLLKNIKDQVVYLNEVWSGDAASSFSNNISGTYESFQNAINYLNEMSANLAKAAANYDEVERMNTINVQ